MRTKHTIERIAGNLASYWSLGVVILLVIIVLEVTK